MLEVREEETLMAMSNEDHKGLQMTGYICTQGEANRTPWNNGDVRKGRAYWLENILESGDIQEGEGGRLGGGMTG